MKSELGSLDFLYDQKQLVGIQSIWGAKKRNSAFCIQKTVTRSRKRKKPASMARLITLENFVPVIHLKEDAETEQFTVCLELEGPADSAE